MVLCYHCGTMSVVFLRYDVSTVVLCEYCGVTVVQRLSVRGLIQAVIIMGW